MLLLVVLQFNALAGPTSGRSAFGQGDQSGGDVDQVVTDPVGPGGDLRGVLLQSHGPTSGVPGGMSAVAVEGVHGHQRDVIGRSAHGGQSVVLDPRSGFRIRPSPTLMTSSTS